MAEAKPCPFCGCQSVAVQPGSTFRWVFAECMECGASTGEERVQTSGSGTPAEWAADAEARAMAEWNRRADDESAALRQIISDCAAAVGNGTGVGPTCSLDFMRLLPDEIRAAVTPPAASGAALLTDADVELRTKIAFESTIDQENKVMHKYWFARGLREGAALASPQVAPTPVPAAWLRNDGGDAWTDAKKSNAIDTMGHGGKAMAATFDRPLYLAAPVQVAPAGLKLAPVEPTPEMIAAVPFPTSVTPRLAVECWRAMIAAAPMQPGAAADDARDAATFLQPADYAALARVGECLEDDEGYDVPAETMKRLAELGVVRRRTGSIYSVTSFGSWVLGTWEVLPLQTTSDANVPPSTPAAKPADGGAA